MGALLLSAAANAPEILSVRLDSLDGTPALRVLANATWGEVGIKRGDDEIELLLPATAGASVKAPEPIAPVTSVVVEPGPEQTLVRVRLLPGTRHELHKAGSLLTLLFGGSLKQARDVDHMYPLLFPEPIESPPPVAPASPEPDQGGTRFGFLRFQPGLVIRYVEAQGAFRDSPQPTRASYWQVDPRLNLGLSISNGRVSASYEPRLRFGPKALPILRETTHLFDAGAELPIGTSLWGSVSGHHARGTLEAQEVDPGAEYFFGLRPFTRNLVTLGLRTDFGGRWNLVTGGAWDRTNLEEGAAFPDHERRTVTAGIRYELTPAANLRLEYELDKIPPSDQRREIEARAHSLRLHVDGELLPLFTSRLGIGYRDQRNPSAPAGGDSYRGLTAGGDFRKEFSRGSRLTFGGGREVRISAFERNAFYVSDSVRASLLVPLRLSLAFLTSAGIQRNSYRLGSAAAGEPRRDRMFGWAAGLGRPLTRFAFLRVDYRRDRRSSNIDPFNVTNWSLTTEFGIGRHGLPIQ
jgi:hypothetical protein